MTVSENIALGQIRKGVVEQNVKLNQFDNLRKEKTSIFVSHRLSSAVTADKIVVLEYGKIIEIGSHTELMKLHKRYYELFTTQARRYQSTAMED